MFSNKLEFKGAIIGMLLGDASIPKIQNGINNSLTLTHCIKQKEYLEYKQKILSMLTECKVYEKNVYLKGNRYEAISLFTRRHPFYTKLREHFYFQGRKTVNEHLLKCLSIHGLALWYQDDGCLTDHSNFLTPFLCTHGFNKTENELLVRMLQKQFGLQWRLRKDKQYYCLRLRRCDREEFFKLIDPYICNSMRYKIRSDGKKAERFDSVKIDCLNCKQQFSVQFNRRNRKFCSCKCYFIYRKKECEKREESQK